MIKFQCVHIVPTNVPSRRKGAGQQLLVFGGCQAVAQATGGVLRVQTSQGGVPPALCGPRYWCELGSSTRSMYSPILLRRQEDPVNRSASTPTQGTSWPSRCRAISSLAAKYPMS